jgi:deoxyadenosine/deoxycytidine kinase
VLFYKYDSIRKLFFKKKKKKTYHIGVTGAVASGKSTFIKYLYDVLSKNNNVYICEEMAIICNTELAHLYSDVIGEREINKLFKNGSIGRLSFWFQTILLDKYEEFYKYKLNELKQQYDIIIYDRTYLDTIFFNKINIDDKLDLEYLNYKINHISNENNINFDLVIYLDPGFDKIIEYKEKRDRIVEKNIDYEYLKKIYHIYSNNIINIYPYYILFDSSLDLKEYENNILRILYNTELFE